MGGGKFEPNRRRKKSTKAISKYVHKHYERNNLPKARHRCRVAEKIFTRLDLNGNGEISLAEFMSQSVDNLSQAEVAELREEFALYDLDNNGKIDRFEFVTQTIKRYEDVKDGDFEDWARAMLDPKMLKPHHIDSLKRAGIDVDDDYVDPPDPLRLLVERLKRLLMCRKKSTVRAEEYKPQRYKSMEQEENNERKLVHRFTARLQDNANAEEAFRQQAQRAAKKRKEKKKAKV